MIQSNNSVTTVTHTCIINIICLFTN